MPVGFCVLTWRSGLPPVYTRRISLAVTTATHQVQPDPDKRNYREDPTTQQTSEWAEVPSL